MNIQGTTGERRGEIRTVLVLGTAQTLAWASSYYLPAIIVDPLSAELGVSSTAVFLAFSAALLLSALMGPWVGRTIDTFGGRGTLATSNVVIAAGLTAMGLASSLPMVWLAWIMLGAGMALGLYDSAFATLGRLYGLAARRPITGITLLAGFASTIGWPLTAWGVTEIGWRNTCFAWAAVHLLIGLPLNLSLPRSERITSSSNDGPSPQVVMDRNMILLAVAFAAAWMVTAAMGAHLPRILMAGGATAAEAVTAAALMGPGQVAARLVEMWLMARAHPLVTARLAAVAHPAGAAVLLAFGGGFAAAALSVLHGVGNGILTISRGTVPLAIFGPVNYGYRIGLLGASARFAQAIAPVLFGLLLDGVGVHVLWFTTALYVLALVALLAVSAPRQTTGK